MFLQAAGAAVVSLPLRELLLPAQAPAASSLPRQEISDPAAQRLGYVHESPKASRRCAECQLYSAAGSAEWGRCKVFPGKLVSARGWCYSWSA